jgi:ribosomal protein S18 acetylase RimI-like enzyme
MGLDEHKKTWRARQVPPVEPVWLSKVEVRLLVRQDLPALEWDGEYAHYRRLYRDIYRAFCKGTVLMWVADLHDVGIIGQVFVHLKSARRELADGITRAYVYGFRVRSPYRGFGIGARLLQTVEDDLVKRRFLWITLNVSRQNVDARRFYERYGFHVVAPEAGNWSYLDEQDRRHEVHEPAWRMEKRIVEADFSRC